MEKDKTIYTYNLYFNYLRRKTLFTTPCERRVKEVKEASSTVMASGTIDSLTHWTENDFLQTADHGTLNAQDRDVVLVDLRRDLCGVWNIHFPGRYW